MITLLSIGNTSAFASNCAATGLLLGDGAGFFLTWAKAPPEAIRKAKAATESCLFKFILLEGIYYAKMLNESISYKLWGLNYCLAGVSFFAKASCIICSSSGR